MHVVFYGLGIFPWACIKRNISYSPWEYDVNVWLLSRLRIQVQDVPSRSDHMLEVCRPFGDDGYVKIFLSEVFWLWSLGEQFARLHQLREIKKGGPVWGDQDCHHPYLDQMDYAQVKVWPWLVFSFISVFVVVMKPFYRIDSYTIEGQGVL
jgi:hypothetical protein